MQKVRFCIVFMIVLFSTSYVCAGWKAISPPAVSSDWTLYRVHFTSSTEGWAVGSDFRNKEGVLLHYSGGRWRSVNPPTVSSDWGLSSVHFVSSSEGWAAGHDMANAKGVLLHYHDGIWTSVSAPYRSSSWQINDIHFISEKEGWAVGVDTAISVSYIGILLHYLNGGWSVVSPPFVSSSWGLNGVHFTSASEGWAVGDDLSFQGGGVSLRYQKGSWTPAKLPNAGRNWDLQSVRFTSSKDGWAVGNDYQFPVDTGLLLHYSNGTWTPVRPSHSSLSWYLLDTFFMSSTEGWAVGADVSSSSTQTGLLIHYSGGSWSFVSPPQVSSEWYLSGVHLTSSDEGWAVGGDTVNGRGVLLRYIRLPEITVTPPSLDFGNVSMGKAPKKTITVRNDGDLDLTLGSIENPEDPFHRNGGTCKNRQVLAPGGRCTVVAQFTPVADGLFASSLAIASDDPDEPDVIVNLTGRSGAADLTGEWESLTQTCSTSKSGTRCKLTGILAVENAGYTNVPSSPTSYLKFYLSDDDTYDIGDTYLKKIALGGLKAGVSRDIKFSHTLPVGLSAAGRYVIAIIDANSRVLESSETNNTLLSDKIP